MVIMNRKKWVIMPLLFILVVVMQSLPSVSLALNQPAIYIEDASIIDTLKTPGTQITVSIKTNSTASDIWGYEFVLTYNPLVLNGNSTSNGDLVSDATHPTTENLGTFDDVVGKLSLTGAYFDALTNVTTGDGDDTLATVTFDVVGTGDTPITLEVETKLMANDGTNIIDAQSMPFNIGDGYFSNVVPAPVHDVMVVSGTTNATTRGPYKSRPVEVNATVKNNGNVKERLDVSIYWGAISGDWLIKHTIVDLNSGVQTTISFVWVTTDPYGYGTKNITVVVAEVYNSTTTDNNQMVIDEVHVRMLGNIDGDTDVDRDDTVDFASTYNPPTGYNAEADFNFDGVQDSTDFIILLGNRGRSE
jgi:hypothetical protein